MQRSTARAACSSPRRTASRRLSGPQVRRHGSALAVIGRRRPSRAARGRLGRVEQRSSGSASQIPEKNACATVRGRRWTSSPATHCRSVCPGRALGPSRRAHALWLTRATCQCRRGRSVRLGGKASRGGTVESQTPTRTAMGIHKGRAKLPGVSQLKLPVIN